MSRRIANAFARARADGRAAFMPFLVAGDPSLAATAAALAALEAAGADIVEVGFPYSDPLADGPVIQRANQRSLRAGTTIGGVFEAIRAHRSGSEMPLVAMAAASLLQRSGARAFAERARGAGFDALIVPDLPIEAIASFFGGEKPVLPLVLLVAPTTPAARAAKIARASREFVYVVSLTGVTGSRIAAESDLQGTVSRVRAGAGSPPVAVGFGVSTPEEAAAVARIADGVIVGSALVTAAESGGAAALERAARGFAEAIRGVRVVAPR